VIDAAERESDGMNNPWRRIVRGPERHIPVLKLNIRFDVDPSAEGIVQAAARRIDSRRGA
jgi:hypothetical protein